MKAPWMFWPLTLSAVVALAACGSATGSPQPGAATAAPTQLTSGQAPRNQCDAAAAQSWVGKAYEPAMLGEALRASGADVARVLRVDSMVTKEFQAGRLNIVLDASGQQVVRVHCG